jgi:hypothetical protein
MRVVDHPNLIIINKIYLDKKLTRNADGIVLLVQCRVIRHVEPREELPAVLEATVRRERRVCRRERQALARGVYRQVVAVAGQAS